MKKSLRITLIIVGSILLLLVLATLLAPPIAKGYVNKHGEELTGRRIHIDAVRLNVFTGHVALRNAAALLDISLLDHIIVARNKYFSFSEENYRKRRG